MTTVKKYPPKKKKKLILAIKPLWHGIWVHGLGFGVHGLVKL